MRLVLAWGVLALVAALAAPGPPMLRPGVETSLSLTDKAGRSFGLMLARGDYAEVRLSRQDGPVAVVVNDPAGIARRQWIRDPEAAAGSACPQAHRPDAAWVADTPGVWRVDVLPPEGFPAFDVAIVLSARRKATDADRRLWEAEIADARVGALLDEGKAGEAAEVAGELIRLREAEHSGDPLDLASDLGWLGVRFYQSALCRGGAWAVAERLVRRTLALREGALAKDDLCVAESLSLVASVLYAEGRFEEGSTLETRSLAIRESRLPASLAAWRRGSRDVGLLLLQQGKYSEARGYFERALASIEKDDPPDPHVLADASHNIGELYRNQNQYDEAARAFRRAESAERAAGETDWLLLEEITTSLAGLSLDRAEYDEAERFAKRYLDMLKDHPEGASPDRLAMGQNNLGEIYRRQGRWKDAEPLLVDSLDAARDALCPENPALLFYRVNLAMLYAEEGRLDAAVALYRESLEAQEKILGPDHPNVSWNLHDYADTLADAGRYGEARPLYERALAIREAVYGTGHPVTETTRVHLSRAILEEDSSKAASLLPSVEAARRALAESPAYPEAAIDALTLEADLLDRLGRQAEARGALGAALDGIETLRPRRGGGERSRADFVRRHLDDYDRMIAWSLAAGDDEAAFEFAERSRARALLDLLTSGTGDLRRSLDPATRNRLEAREAEAAAALAEAQGRADFERARTDVTADERRARVREQDARIEAAARTLQLVADDVKNESPLWRDAVGATGAPPRLADVRRDLVEDGGVLLSYRIGRERSWLFVVPKSERGLVVLPLSIGAVEAKTLGITPGPLTASRLEAILGGGAEVIGVPLLRRLAEPGGGSTEDAAETIAELHALRRALVPDPVWATVRRAREAVIIPDGALAQLPFETLVDRAASDWSASRTWLDAGPPVRYAPSATILESVRRRGVRPTAVGSGVLSVADPDYGGRFTPLPGTRLESKAIVRAFRAAGLDEVTTLQGGAATELAVRAALPSRRFLHLATHGLLTSGTTDLLAGLAFTAGPGTPPDPTDDGLLRLYEIDGLELSADLVVLSACGTGAGRRVAGEGTFSLARGFFAAGTPRVIASLWTVSDASTADLIGSAFRRIARDASEGRSPDYARALRDAKRALRRDPRYAGPFAWAPFTLTGLR